MSASDALSSDERSTEAWIGVALLGAGLVCFVLSIHGLRTGIEGPSFEVTASEPAPKTTSRIQPAPRAFEPAPLPPLPPRRAELLFAFGSTQVDKKRATSSLGPLVRGLKQQRDCHRLLVEGHSDRRGDRGINLDVAWRRAEATKRWLTGQGVSPERIIVRSYGAYKPKISVAPDAEEQRRVEVQILDCSS